MDTAMEEFTDMLQYFRVHSGKIYIDMDNSASTVTAVDHSLAFNGVQCKYKEYFSATEACMEFCDEQRCIAC